MKINGILLLSLAIIFGRCVDKDNSPGIPHIVKVNDFDLSTSFGQGADTHDVNEVWVYSSQDVLGVFPLPATIPYLDVDGNGTVDITILAGIKANGISATRTPYNLYEAMSLEEEFEAGDTTVIETFEAQYLNSAQFILCEDFESTNIFNSNFISSADIVRTTDDEYVIDGNGSGLILLNDSMNQVFSTTQEELYDLQSISGQIWLEYDYKSDNTFSVGLEAVGGAEDGRYPIYVHNSTGGEWKKMYLELGPIVWTTPGSIGYEITLDAILDLGEDSGYIVVDNFKIVHF